MSTGGHSVRRSVTLPLLEILGITVLAAFLRLYEIGAKPLDIDEAFSLWLARLELHKAWEWIVRIDTHPPLYYVALHFWHGLGETEGTLRLLSAMWGTVTIPLSYWLGSIIGGRALALRVALLAAVSPSLVWYSQVARMYAMVAAEATLAMCGLAELLARPDAAAAPIGSGIRAWRQEPGAHRELGNPTWHTDVAWGAYIFGTASALWTLNIALFLPVASNLVALVWWIIQPKARGGFLRNWLIAQAAVLAIWSPWIPSAARQALYVYREFAAPRRDLGTMLTVFHNLYVSLVGRTLSIRVGLDLITLALAGAALWGWRDQRHWSLFALALWLVAPVGESLIFRWRLLIAQELLQRVLLWSVIPFLLLVAAGLARLPWRGVRAVLLVFLMIIGLRGVRNLLAWESGPSWAQIAAHVAEHAESGDLVIFAGNFLQVPFDYYFRRHAADVVRRGFPRDFPAGAREASEKDMPYLRSLAARHRRIWLVHGSGRQDVRRWVIPVLDGLGGLARERYFGAIRVVMYEMR